MKRITTLVVAIAFAGAAPGSALAQGSTCEAYNPQLCKVTPHSDATSGTLPFTGLDVALLAVGGGGLLGTGLAVRRLSRRLD